MSNIFGPPANQRVVRQNDSGAVARQMRYNEGRKRLQTNTAKSPAKSYQGRQSQREAFAQQLNLERQQLNTQKTERDLAEARGGAKWQKLTANNQNTTGTTPTPPSGGPPNNNNNQQAYNRHNTVIQQKSQRDAAWEAKRRKFLEHRNGGVSRVANGAGSTNININNNGGRKPMNQQLTTLPSFTPVPTGMRAPNNQDLPIAQGQLARSVTPNKIMPPQMQALVPEPLSYNPAIYGGGGGSLNIGNGGGAVPTSEQQRQDALSSHMNERQQKQQKQRAYHADLQRQAAAKKAREVASKQASQQAGRNDRGIVMVGGGGGQMLPSMGRTVMNGGMGGGMGDSMGDGNLRLSPPPSRISQADQRKAALQNNDRDGGGGLGIGNTNGYDRQRQVQAQQRRDQNSGASNTQVNLSKQVNNNNNGRRNKAILQNEAGLGINFGGGYDRQKQMIDRANGGGRQQQQQKQRLQQQQQQQLQQQRPLMGTREREKAMLQGGGAGGLFHGGGDGGLRIGYGQNKGTNMKDRNVMHDMYTGGVTKQERSKANDKANAYKAELDLQLRLKNERMAREKDAKKKEDYKERMMLDQQYAAINNIAGGGRKRIQPGGAPLLTHNVLPTAAPGTIRRDGDRNGNVPSSNLTPGRQQQQQVGNGPMVGGPMGLQPERPKQQYVAPNPRPIGGGGGNMARALSPTSMMMGGTQQQFSPTKTYGGPEIHRKYRQGLKDPAEMEHLIQKRQRESEQAAILEVQVLEHKARKLKEKQEQKERDEAFDRKIEKEREELREEHEREVANQIFVQQQKDIAKQIALKKKMKLQKEQEDKEYEKKLQNKIDRDNEELQRQYDEERGIKTSPKKKSRKEKKAEKNKNSGLTTAERLGESRKIKELEEKLRLQSTQGKDPQIEAQLKQMEQERKEAKEEAQRAKEEMKVLRDEMMNLKTSVTRQPVAQSVASGVATNVVGGMVNPTELEMARMKQMADMQTQMQQQAILLQQAQQQATLASPMNNQNLRRQQGPSAAEIELEKMKEEKRTNEMKQLREEMIAMRNGGAASPEVKMLKNELAEMRRASMQEQNDLREKLNASLGSLNNNNNNGSATVDLSGDPGLATVRRTNKELKQQYSSLMDRVEEQSKLITELRQGVVSGNAANDRAGQTGTTHKDIIQMKNELNAMKAEMAMRSMEQEQEKKRSQDIDANLEEELRAMMEDSAGVFTSVAEMEASLPNTGRSVDGSGLPSTARVMSTNMYSFGDDIGSSLNLDAIISGAGGYGAGSPVKYNTTTSMSTAPIRGGGGSGNRSGGGGMGLAGESLSSASKFIFPDGHSAPGTDMVSKPSRGGIGSGNNGGMVPSLRLDQLDASSRQSNIDRLNVTHLYEANNQKLNQLNQLSSNPEDMASQDQLDQLLVDFLNHKAEPNGAVAVGRLGPSLDGRNSNLLKQESRFLKT